MKEEEPYKFPTDFMLAIDSWSEWDHVRYLISEDLKACEIKDGLDPVCLPFILYFEEATKEHLINAGFKKETIENSEELRKIISVLDNDASRCWPNHRFDIHSPYGLPPGSFDIGEDKNIFWVKADIEAALSALESLSIIKELLVNNGVVNKNAVRVYLRSLELIINLSRVGSIPKLALSEVKKKQSIVTRALKKEVMMCIIDNIFKKNPHRPTTLGEVWNKIDRGYEAIKNKKTQEWYLAKTGKITVRNKGKSEEVDGVIILRNGREALFKYAKRSLQNFINELKSAHQNVTQ